jgi:hypothetical protein
LLKKFKPRRDARRNLLAAAGSAAADRKADIFSAVAARENGSADGGHRRAPYRLRAIFPIVQLTVGMQKLSIGSNISSNVSIPSFFYEKILADITT